MPRGNITRMLPEHGYGFLIDDAGLDWFFVREDIRGGNFAALWLDQRVAFEYQSTPSGPRATDIHFEPHAEVD
jgi:cold shock CspA family protein